MRNSAADVFVQVRDKILSGEYPPATALVEADMAEQYGVSRNTIKKVLLMLENKGLVFIEPNKSTKVRSYTLHEVLDQMQIREVLEELIVQLTVPLITDGQLDMMRNILAQMKEHLNKHELLMYSEKNKQFHQIIYDTCPNISAVEMVILIKNRISKFNAKTILIAGRDIQSYREHQEILNAIEQKNKEQAALLMRRHIINVAQTMKEYDRLLF